MTDDGQTGLAEFRDGEDDTSPSGDERDLAAEARAIAGDGDGNGIEMIDPTRDGLDARYGEPGDSLQLSVMQIDYTVAGREPNERPIIHLYGRDAKDEPHHVKVLGFQPYFYAPTDSLDRPPEEEYDELVGSDDTDEDGEPFESIRGEHLTKIYGRTPRDVGNIRDEFDHYEADILFPNRFLIDKDIQSGVEVPVRRDEDGSLIVAHEEVEAVEMTATPRVNTFDLEVDDRHGFPEPDDAEQPIICLTSHDSYDDEYVVWLYDAPVGGVDAPEALDGYEPLTDGADHEVRTFDSEEAMLEAFLDYLEETDPDIFTGWNCLPENASIQMADGTDRTIRDVRVGDEVVGSTNEESTVATVTNKWQSETEVLEFQLADGTTLETSEDHRMMVGDDSDVDWKRGEDVSVGDYVLKPRALPVETPSVPTLSELVPRECQRFQSKPQIKEFKQALPYGAVSELADEFGVAPGTMYSPNTDTWTPERCAYAAQQYDDVALPDGGRRYRRTDCELDRELNHQEAYLAGLVLTDGSMSETDGIRFYNTEQKLHQQFSEEPKLEPDGKGCYKQNVLDYPRMHAFNGLGIPFGNKNDGPVDLSSVYTMPKTYIARFLAGVLDGDGCVSSSITVSAVNESIGRWYVKLFRRLGIYAEQNGETVRIPDSSREISQLKQHVLPHMSHPKKCRRLRSKSGGKSGRSENIPYALFEADIGTDEKRIARDKHRREINLKRHETVSDGWEQYVFVEVDGIEHSGTETTYDLATTTNNFHAEDCLVHNCDDFDVPYLINRLQSRKSKQRHSDGTNSYNLSYDRLSRVGEVWAGGWGGPEIKGRVVFDLLYAYKRTQFTELESYRLDAVGEQELGVGKERYTGDIGDLWEGDPEQLLEYNLRDVELCVELDRKQNIVEFWDEVRTFVGCKLEDAPTPGDAVDMYVLHKVHGNFSLPSKGKHEGEDYEGGAVFDPITGVKENVTVLDLKSLYPMCMVTTNASPETKVDPTDFDGETYRAPNGTHFRKEPDGIIREMVDELLTERENKKELRNEHDPDSEAYARYDQQQGAVKVIMNCFTPDTDVLTPRGIENIRDLGVGDEVYSIDPDTLEMESKPVVETHEYPEYRGDLVDIETSKIDLSVTPNHRMLVRKNETNGITEDGYRFVEAGDLDDATNYELPHDWDGPDPAPIEEVDLTRLIDGEYEVWVRPSVHGHTFTAELGWTPRRVPKADVGAVGYVFTADEFEAHREYIEEVCETSFVHRESGRKWIPRTYDADDFLELLGWYITEGSVYTSEEKQFGDQFSGSATTISLAQDAKSDGGIATDGGSDHAAIGSLLDRLGFDYYVDENGYQFTSKLLGNLLRTLCGTDSFEKRIPDLVFDASRAQKEAVLDTLIARDGDRQPNSWRYSTASEQLRDDVLRLCTHLGVTASYNEDSGTWRIYVTEDGKNTLRMHRSSSRSTADDGVYCVTVEDNHTLLAGRNGTFQFVGQSLYGVLGWDRFRLYDKEMGAAVTATGRDVIEFTEEAANELDYEVTYGDSVTGDRPIVVRDPSGAVRIRPIEELFGAGRDLDVPGEVVLTADGGTVGTATTGKDRRRLDGWEALSLSETGQAEWQPIEGVVRHQTDKPVCTLQHKFGESTVTRDHSFVVEQDDEYVEAKPENVDEPLRVPDVPPVERVETIDVYELLDGYVREYEDGRSGGSENAISKTKRVHADDERVWFGHEHHDGIESTVSVQRHIDIDSQDGRALVRLLAAYISEGSASTVETTASRFGASIGESRREWLEGLQADYRRLFDGASAGITASDSRERRVIESDDGDDYVYDDGTLKLQMMNELSAVFFREFAGQTSGGKRIPSFVFHLPSELQDLFIDVLVEGDGSREFPRYSEQYCERNFDYETASRELAAGLSMLLTQRGRKHSLNYRSEKGSYTIRTCDFYRSGREPVVREVNHDGFVYDLSVAENENFVDGVGGVVLHNTDSVMLELGPDIETDDAIEQSFEIEDHINSAYDRFASEELNAEQHRFQIEFEKLYRRFFQAGKKKRYAGHIVWKEGKDVDDIDITGFEYKRSDIAQITKEVQLEVITRIVRGEDIEEVKTYVHEIIQEVQAGNISLDEIGIPGGIGKKLDNYDTDTAQVRGAKYANELLGTNFSSGSKPKRLYLKKVHPSYFERLEAEEGFDPQTDPLYGEFKRDPDVICFEYDDQIPEEFEVDYEKMLDKTLKGPIERVLEALDISWGEVKSGQEQTGLGSFM